MYDTLQLNDMLVPELHDIAEQLTVSNYKKLEKQELIDKIQYQIMIDSINNIYEGWGEAFQHDEAIRNASLSAMLFMLLAKNKEWDTCPMIYFDKEKIIKLLNIPENEVPVVMITMGKMDKSSSKIRGYRKPVAEFVKFY